MDELNLRRYFKAVLGGDDVQHGKPDPEIFLRAAKALEVEPQHSLVFEDALGEIEAARRANMHAIMICTTIDSGESVGMSHVLAAIADFTYLDLVTLLALSECNS